MTVSLYQSPNLSHQSGAGPVRPSPVSTYLYLSALSALETQGLVPSAVLITNCTVGVTIRASLRKVRTRPLPRSGLRATRNPAQRLSCVLEHPPGTSFVNGSDVRCAKSFRCRIWSGAILAAHPIIVP